jgi:hypothetical protein
VAVPAFAVSSSTAPPTAGLDTSCKCAGAGANNYDFKTVLHFTGSTTTHTVSIVSWSFDGVAQALPSPNSFTLTGGSGDVVVVTNKTNSAAKHDVSVTYNITNSVTLVTTTVTVSQIALPYSPSCTAPVTC